MNGYKTQRARVQWGNNLCTKVKKMLSLLIVCAPKEPRKPALTEFIIQKRIDNIKNELINN